MPQTATPWFVAEKRAAKADQIARHLRLVGVDADRAARMSDRERRDIEAAANIKRPGSDRTWRSVVEMLAGSAMPGALCPTCGQGDPLGPRGPRQTYGHAGACSR